MWHNNVVHKPISIPKAVKRPAARSAMEKYWSKWRMTQLLACGMFVYYSNSTSCWSNTELILHDNATCHKSYTIQVSESHQTNYIHHTSQLRIFLTLNLTSQHTSWAIQHVLQKTSTGRPGAVRTSSESSIFHWTFSLRIANRRMTVRTESAHRYPLPRAFFQVLTLRHILTHCAHSQHF